MASKMRGKYGGGYCEPKDGRKQKDSPSLKVARKLCNLGLISWECFKLFREKLSATKAVVNSQPLEDRAPDDEVYWTGIRNLFAYDENDANDAVPINAANYSPTFHDVQLLMNQYNLELNKNISIQNRVEELSLVIDAARELIATQLGVTSQEVALMRNGTEANNNLNNGQILNSTDEVVLWAENHPTNNQAWYIRQTQRPFVIRMIPSDFNGATTDADIVAEFVNLVNANTKFLTFSHLSNVSGRLLPAEDICRAVHAKNSACHVHVDGAQTWGSMQLNLVQMDCDSYSASSHKWFVGPKETGILYMKLNLIPNFIPNTFGYDLKIIVPDDLYTDARRFETLGQRADPSLMCLLNTAEVLGEIGFQAIQDRVSYLGTLTYNGYEAFPNFPMTTPANELQRLGVVIAGVDPTWGADLYNYLYEVHRIAVASTGGIRISPTITNTAEQIQTLIDATAEYIATNPPPTPPGN